MVKSRWSRYPRSSGTAVWDEGEVCKLRFSAEVNPEIQHVPADLLQTKSQPVIFSFYILLEFLSIWTPLQWSIGAPIHRQSMYRAISSSPTQPQIASATLPSTHPYSSLTNLSKLQWATTNTYVLADLFHADPTYHLHSHSSLFQWLQVWKNSNKLSSCTKDRSFSGGGGVGFILRFLLSSLWYVTSSRTSLAEG